MNVFDCGEKKTAHKMAEALLKLTESTSLRGKVVDGVHYFSVYDFLNFLTGHERGDEHARKVFFDLCVAKVCELIKSVQGFADSMTMLDSDWKDDACLVRRVKDFARTSVLETPSSLLHPR